MLAGHSFGGPITRFFAATHPKLVAGLALIDPAGDDQRRRLAEAAPSYGATSNFDPAIAGRKCVALIEKDPIPEGTADYKSCMGDWPPADIPPELKAAVVRERGASFQRAQLAEAEGLKAGGSVAQEGGAVRRSLGDIPLIVLTRGLRSAPPDVSPSEKEAYIGVWQRMHWEDAGLSTHGRRRFVEGATHYVQRDKPEAVITAVKEVVAEARSRGR